MSRKWSVTQFLLEDTTHDYSVGTIVTSNHFKNWIVEKYPGWYFLTGSYYNSDTNKMVELATTKEEAAARFYSAFTLWLDDRLEAFQRMQSALDIEYSPLENYDRIETGTIKDDMHKGSKSTRTPNLTNTMTPNTTQTDETEAYGYDSTVASDTAKNTSTLTGSTTSNQTGSETTSIEDISATVFDNNLKTLNTRTHGNIGVTTSQQMLQSEIDLRRKFALVDMIIEEFVYQNLIYEEEV